MSLYTKNRWVINVMGRPINVGGQYPFITFFTLPSLSGKLVIFLGRLNNLELWGADIGNAYLEAFTDEKLYIVAGPDISIILLFTFYQPVFYATYDQHFPSESEERAGYSVGLGEHCGDAMTHKILDHDTQKIIYRSAVRPKKSSTPNHRLAPHGGEVSASSDPSEDKISSGSPLGYPEGSSPEQKALQSSSGPEMKRIHLDPSLCLHLTLVTSLVGLSYFHLKRMGRDIEPRLPDMLLKSLTRTMAKE